MLRQLKTQLTVENLTLDLVQAYLYKSFYQQVLLRRPTTRRILCIWGCQRSGTSLMTRIFFRDIRTKVYRESSMLSSQDAKQLRLNPFDKLRTKLARDKAPLVVLKPLVESQNALKFLDCFPAARGLWLYRHYRDVAISNLQAFGPRNGIDDLRPITQNLANNWRSENVSAATRQVILEHFSETMNPHDAAALFWFARNQLFFELNLEDNAAVRLCQYEDLVTNPHAVMQQIYQFLDVAYPGPVILTEIHGRSVQRGKELELSPAIDALCSELLERLDRLYSASAALNAASREESGRE